MKSKTKRTTGSQPRIIAVRKPLRPVQVAATRTPIKVTAPIFLGVAHPVRRAV